jgi:RNase P/RNase MRP subunit POP5
MGICRLDTEAILAHGEVYKCDVTKDISSTQMQEIISQMKQSLTNYDKWTCAKYQGNGLVIYNTVKTDKCKKRLSIYDKHKELNKACNREFLNTISNREKLLAYYQDKIRFELNIDTKAQIRLLLGVMDNRLHSVLSSNANPILTVFDEAIKQDEVTAYHSELKEYMMALMIKECHNDLEEVEAKIRAMSPKTASIRRKMQPFRDLHTKMQKNVATNIDVRSLIA